MVLRVGFDRFAVPEATNVDELVQLLGLVGLAPVPPAGLHGLLHRIPIRPAGIHLPDLGKELVQVGNNELAVAVLDQSVEGGVEQTS